MRDYVVGKVIRIQTYVRMRQARNGYMKRLAYLYQGSTVCIQKFAKGYLVTKKMREQRSILVIKNMTSSIENLMQKHSLDLQIKLKFAYNRYLRQKKIAEEEERKLAMEQMAK